MFNLFRFTCMIQRAIFWCTVVCPTNSVSFISARCYLHRNKFDGGFKKGWRLGWPVPDPPRLWGVFALPVISTSCILFLFQGQVSRFSSHRVLAFNGACMYNDRTRYGFWSFIKNVFGNGKNGVWII